MKWLVFNKTRRDDPGAFFAKLEITERETLGIIITLGENDSYQITVEEKEDTSLIVSMMQGDYLLAWKVYGEVSPDEVTHYPDNNVKCILADIVNEIYGLDTEKYFNWSQNE